VTWNATAPPSPAGTDADEGGVAAPSAWPWSSHSKKFDIAASRRKQPGTSAVRKLDVDAYIAQLGDRWAPATFATALESFTHDARLVEPYLATLRATG